MGVLWTWVKFLIDLQILGCELHKKTRLAAGLCSAHPEPLAVITGREGDIGVNSYWAQGLKPPHFYDHGARLYDEPPTFVT